MCGTFQCENFSGTNNKKNQNAFIGLVISDLDYFFCTFHNLLCTVLDNE